MKKSIIWALATLFAFVSCSDNEPSTQEFPQTSITASSYTIGEKEKDYPEQPPMLGMQIGGAAYTEYTFEAGDQIRVVSEKGLNVILTAENSGKENIRFVGDFKPVAEVDTYYALYPATYDLQPDGSFPVTDYYSGQSGEEQDAALLGAVARDVSGENLHLEFFPINTLLHVAIENAPQKIDSAIIKPHSPGELVSNGTYYIDYQNEGPAFYYDIEQIKVPEFTIENPNSEGFFFNFACGWFTEGFDLILISGSDKLVRSYEGMTLAPGCTYRTIMQWEGTLPKGAVQCGVRTSYNYYQNRAVDMANQMTDIAFILGDKVTLNGVTLSSSAYSTYSEIEDSEISSAGVILLKEGGDKAMIYSLPFANGVIGYDCEFNLTYEQIEWGKYTATAFLLLKDGRKVLSDSVALHVTGLPYDTQAGEYHGFYTENERTWTDGAMEPQFMKFYWNDITNGSLNITDSAKWYGHNGVALHAAMLRWAQILSPKFHIPDSIYIQATWSVSCMYEDIELGLEFSTPDGGDSGTDLLTSTLDGGDEETITSEIMSFTPEYPCLQIEHRSAQVLPSSMVDYLKIYYR